MDPHPQQIFPTFLWNRKAFLQNKFLPIGSSLGHLSMKDNFQIRPTILALKLDKARVLGVASILSPIEQRLTYFSDHEDDIQSYTNFGMK